MDKLDATDAHLLRLLQADGRAKRTALAEAVGLSLPSVSDRLRKLEAKGVLTGFTATVDAKRVGMDVTAFVRIVSGGSDRYDEFVAAVTALPEVLELHSITGDGSHLLKVRVRTTTALEALLARVQQLPGVRGTRTSIVLSTMKETQTVSVQPGPLTPVEDTGKGGGDA